MAQMNFLRIFMNEVWLRNANERGDAHHIYLPRPNIVSLFFLINTCLHWNSFHRCCTCDLHGRRFHGRKVTDDKPLIVCMQNGYWIATAKTEPHALCSGSKSSEKCISHVHRLHFSADVMNGVFHLDLLIPGMILLPHMSHIQFKSYLTNINPNLAL